MCNICTKHTSTKVSTAHTPQIAPRGLQHLMWLSHASQAQLHARRSPNGKGLRIIVTVGQQANHFCIIIILIIVPCSLPFVCS